MAATVAPCGGDGFLPGYISILKKYSCCHGGLMAKRLIDRRKGRRADGHDHPVESPSVPTAFLLSLSAPGRQQ